jgi:hypothetical protein
LSGAQSVSLVHARWHEPVVAPEHAWETPQSSPVKQLQTPPVQAPLAQSAAVVHVAVSQEPPQVLPVPQSALVVHDDALHLALLHFALADVPQSEF